VKLLNGREVDAMPVWQLYLVHFQDYDLDTLPSDLPDPEGPPGPLARDAGSIKPAAIHNGEERTTIFHQTSNSVPPRWCSSSRATWEVRRRAVYLAAQLQSRMLDGDALVRRRSWRASLGRIRSISPGSNAHGKEIKTNQYYYGEEVGYWLMGTPP